MQPFTSLAWRCKVGLLLLLFNAAGLLAGESLERQIENASHLRHRNQHSEAIDACETILKNKKTTPKQRLEAYGILNDVYRRWRKYKDGIKAGERVRAMFPNDKDIERAVLFAIADHYRELRKYDEGIKVMEELLEKQGEDKQVAAGAHRRIGWLYARKNERQEAYDHAAKAIELDPTHEWRVADCLTLMQDMAWHLGKLEACHQALVRLIQPTYLKQRGRWEHQNLWRRTGDCLVRMKKLDEARTFYAGLEKEVKDKNFQQECALRIAWTQTNDKAIQAYERVFTDYPDTTRHWYSAQSGIVKTLREQGKFKEALSAARILLDAASNGRSVAERVQEVAELFFGLDRNAKRANIFINYQRFGPAGEDGKRDTPDDLRNPLVAIPYPTYPARAQAFAKARQEAGDSAASFQYRGHTYIYTGHPKQAIQEYAKAFRLCTGREIQSMTDSLLFVGVRAVIGHTAGLETYYDYVNYGPDGPDGKANTPDDIADPFTKLLK